MECTRTKKNLNGNEDKKNFWQSIGVQEIIVSSLGCDQGDKCRTFYPFSKLFSGGGGFYKMDLSVIYQTELRWKCLC
jgi:hypothetical protein